MRFGRRHRAIELLERPLVSGGVNGTVRMWDVPRRRLIETYRWHKSWVTFVAVSPDGPIAAGSNDIVDRGMGSGGWVRFSEMYQPLAECLCFASGSDIIRIMT